MEKGEMEGGGIRGSGVREEKRGERGTERGERCIRTMKIAREEERGR